MVGLESDDLVMRRLSAREIGKYGPQAAGAADALLANLTREFPVVGTPVDKSASWIDANRRDPASAGPSKVVISAGFNRAELALFEYRSEYLWALASMGPSAKDASSRRSRIEGAHRSSSRRDPRP
jgi:hypothetical protein